MKLLYWVCLIVGLVFFFNGAILSDLNLLTSKDATQLLVFSIIAFLVGWVGLDSDTKKEGA